MKTSEDQSPIRYWVEEQMENGISFYCVFRNQGHEERRVPPESIARFPYSEKGRINAQILCDTLSARVGPHET